MIRRCLTALAVLLGLASGSPAQQPLFQHSADWVRQRLHDMVASDDAYLWHDVLGGRAIHQNSTTSPPSVPLEGNFVPAQQSFFALAKMDLYQLSGGHDEKQLEDSKTLLDWVANNGYMPDRHTVTFKYNQPNASWDRTFYPEFNMFSVAAGLRYDAIRSTTRYASMAEDVYGTVVNTAWDSQYGGFMSSFTYNTQTGQYQTNGDKGIYAAGYNALLMLDSYDATRQGRFLQQARAAVDAVNQHLWDSVNGGWLISTNRQWDPSPYGTKYTHVNADLVQANYRLYLAGQGQAYLDRAEAGMAFLTAHAQGHNGLWYRHTNIDGSNPNLNPEGGGDGGSGVVYCYDRQMQMIDAFLLGYQATGKTQYLQYVDSTLDVMEQTHLIDYPVGANYGYMGASSQNTWCHMWGLRAMAAMAKLQTPELEAVWNGGGGPENWFDANNWSSNRVPTPASHLVISSGVPVSISSVNIVDWGNVTISGGQVAWNGQYNTVGNVSFGSLQITDGSLTVTMNVAQPHSFNVGNGPSGRGVIQQQGGAVTVNDTVVLGNNGAESGDWYIRGGSLQVQNDLKVGPGNAAGTFAYAGASATVHIGGDLLTGGADDTIAFELDGLGRDIVAVDGAVNLLNSIVTIAADPAATNLLPGTVFTLFQADADSQGSGVLTAPGQVIYDSALWSVNTLTGVGGTIRAIYVGPRIAPVPGDTNGDGVVDATDAQVLAENWGAIVTTGDLTAGDFDGDGLVGPKDASILAANWTGTGESAASVPEPSMIGLILSEMAALLMVRSKKARTDVGDASARD